MFRANFEPRGNGGVQGKKASKNGAGKVLVALVQVNLSYPYLLVLIRHITILGNIAIIYIFSYACTEVLSGVIEEFSYDE